MSRTLGPATSLSAAALLAIAAATSACAGTGVTLSAAEFQSRLVDQSGGYRGSHLHLVTPTNQAENTTIFYYYSADRRVSYGGPALTSYLWYGLEKAFDAVGIMVHENEGEYPAPELDLTFTSWTETEFVGEIRLRGTQGYRRQLHVVFPNPPGPTATLAERKAFAYNQLDLIAACILDDKQFKASLLAAQPPAQ